MVGRVDEAQSTLSAAEEILAKSDGYLLGSVLHMHRHLWSAIGDANRIRYYGRRELEFGQKNGDPIKIAEGQFALVDGLCRSGETGRAIALGHETIETLEPIGFFWISIPTHELGRAYLQAGDYENAVTWLKRASMRVVKGRLVEITSYAIPLYVEALLGPHWHDRSQPINRAHLRRARFYCRVARSSSVLFPNIRPQSLRMAGRIMAARGSSRKAFRFFDRSIAVAEKIGIDYEHARALIDKSLLDYSDAMADRQRGLQMLEELGCVLPVAEQEYLGISMSVSTNDDSEANEGESASE